MEDTKLDWAISWFLSGTRYVTVSLYVIIIVINHVLKVVPTHPPTHPHVIWQKPLSILDNVWIVAGLRWVVDDKRCCWCVHYSLTPTTTNRRNGFSSSCRSRNSRWSATSTKCIRWVGTHISYYCCRPMSQRHLLPHNVGYMQAMYSQCRSNPSVCHTVTPHEASQNGWITIA